VPANAGVYLVLRTNEGAPSFLERSPGGRFKGKDPTVATETLEHEWVTGARVVYIGKADHLGRRLRQFARFGAGEPVGHWGADTSGSSPTPVNC